MSIIRPLIVQCRNSPANGFLFKNPTDTEDKNVYGIVPYHSITNNTEINNLEFLLLGNDQIKPTSQIILNGVFLGVKHFLLDTAMFVITNPHKIIGTVFESSLNMKFFNERVIDTPTLDIMEVNHGSISSDSVRVLSNNYITGSVENKLPYQKMAEPGLIHLDLIAKKGFSGCTLSYNNTIYGFISRSSGNADNSTDKNNCLAVKSYHTLPWISQCCKAVHRYVQNKPDRLQSLLNPAVMDILNDDFTPSVCSLGCSFIHYPYGNSSSRNGLGVQMYFLYKYLDVSRMFLQTDILNGNSLKYKTLLNSNSEFVREFYSDVVNNTYYITKISYTDVMTSKRVVIDYDNDSINANIDEYSFRGDKQASVELEIVKETQNGDRVDQTRLNYTFNPVKIAETINGEVYERQSSELTTIYYNSWESKYYLSNRKLRLVDHSADTPAVRILKSFSIGEQFRYNYLSSLPNWYINELEKRGLTLEDLNGAYNFYHSLFGKNASNIDYFNINPQIY